MTCSPRLGWYNYDMFRQVFHFVALHTLAFAVLVAGVSPLVNLAAASYDVNRSTTCCCGTVDGHCCGTSCCIDRTPGETPTPCSNRTAEEDNRLVVAVGESTSGEFSIARSQHGLRLPSLAPFYAATTLRSLQVLLQV